MRTWKRSETASFTSSASRPDGDVPALQWPAMSMEFAVHDKRQLAALKAGDRVQFVLRRDPNPDGSYVIERIGK